MKVHLRFDSNNPTHSRLTLFVNGANTGDLCMSPAEAIWFNHIISKGCAALSPSGAQPIVYVSSGKGPNPSTKEINDVISA